MITRLRERYYERIIRTERELNLIRIYITHNPRSGGFQPLPKARQVKTRTAQASSAPNRDIRRRRNTHEPAAGRGCTGRGASRRNVRLCPGSLRSARKRPRRKRVEEADEG